MVFSSSLRWSNFRGAKGEEDLIFAVSRVLDSIGDLVGVRSVSCSWQQRVALTGEQPLPAS